MVNSILDSLGPVLGTVVMVPLIVFALIAFYVLLYVAARVVSLGILRSARDMRNDRSHLHSSSTPRS